MFRLRTFSSRIRWATSEIILGFDYQDFTAFLDFVDVVHVSPFMVFKAASAWLQKHPERMGQRAIQDAQAEDYFESLLFYLKLGFLPPSEINAIWGEGQPITERILTYRLAQIRPRFLIIPYAPDKRETSTGFVCHNLETGENYFLDAPAVDGPGEESYGEPKLCVAMGDRDADWEQQEPALHCFRGVRSSSSKGSPSFHRYKYLYSKKQ